MAARQPASPSHEARWSTPIRTVKLDHVSLPCAPEADHLILGHLLKDTGEWESEPLSRCQPTVRRLRSLISQRGAIATQHVSRSPAEKAHGISFASTKGQPVVSSRVSKLV